MSIDLFLNGLAVIMPGVVHQEDLYQYLLDLGVRWSSGEPLGSFDSFKSRGAEYGSKICYRIDERGLHYASYNFYTESRYLRVLEFQEVADDIMAGDDDPVDSESLLSILGCIKGV